MKKYTTILFFFFITNFFCQNKTNEVVYKLIFSVDSNSEMNQTKEKFLKLAEKGSNNVKFRLLFNDSISKFSKVNYIESEDKSEKYAIAWCGCDYEKYNLNKQKVLIYNNKLNKLGTFKKNEFLIEKQYTDDWILTNEFKLINDFKCYKATKTVKIVNDIKEFSRIITAWYCPELPYSFGPNGYSNLPGLILELNENNLTFGVESINFNIDMKDQITVPNEGEKISEEKYKVIIKERTINNMKTVEN
jgi:GLPGLI family protein